MNIPVPKLDVDTKEIVARAITPIVRLQLWGFAVLDIFIGFGFSQIRDPTRLFIANNRFLLSFWSGLFVTIGLLLSYGLATKNAHFSRSIVITDLCSKLMWMLALIIGGTYLIGAVWALVTYLQITNYVFLYDKTNNYEHDGRHSNNS